MKKMLIDDVDLKQLRAFLLVAEHQSFSHAAKVSGLSQPSLSRLVRQLEQVLDLSLFDRYQRPLQLTEAGQFYQQKLQTILLELEQASLLAKNLASAKRVLNIGFVPSVLYGLLPNVVAKMRLDFTSLEIYLKDISSYQQVSALKAGEIDVGFGRFFQEDGDIRQILLRHEVYTVALPNFHPLAQKSVLKIADLVNENLILYHQTHLPKASGVGAGMGITEPLLHIFSRYGITPAQTTRVNDLQVALGLVAGGLGVTLVPDGLKTVRPKQIAYVKLLHENATSPIYLYTLSSPKPEVRQLLEVVYQIYEDRGITYRKQQI